MARACTTEINHSIGEPECDVRQLCDTIKQMRDSSECSHSCASPLVVHDVRFSSGIILQIVEQRMMQALSTVMKINEENCPHELFM